MLLKESAGRLNSFWGVVGGSCGWSGVSDSLVAYVKYEVVNLFDVILDSWIHLGKDFWETGIQIFKKRLGFF